MNVAEELSKINRMTAGAKPAFDAFTAASAKLDFDSLASVKIDQVVGASAWAKPIASCQPAAASLYQVKCTESLENWVAAVTPKPSLLMEIRDWTRNFAKWMLAQPGADSGALGFDLKAFLKRRRIRGIERRARWARRSKLRRLGAQLLLAGDALLSRLGGGLRTDSSVPKVLLALLEAPPGWTTAARFRTPLESSLPKILEQLVEVIAPNAPSRLDRTQRFPIEAGAIPAQ